MTGSMSPVLIAAAVEEAAKRLATDPAAAEAQAQAVLKRSPQDPRALLVLASARRRLGDPKAALALLGPLARAHPRAARTHYELGLARAGCGQTSGALSALRHAVSINRDLPEAWRALGDMLFKAGDIAGADAAYAEHLRAGVTHPQLKAAADSLAADAPARAETQLRAYLAGASGDVHALAMLGDTLGRLGRQAEAEPVLEACLRLDPGFDGARFTYATVLFQQQKAAEAIPHVRRLLARDAGDPAYRNLLAACLSLVGDFDEVDALYRALLDEYPDQPRLWLNHGHALRTVRRSGEAALAYRRCIALAPDLGDAYWSLANLKVAVFTDDEVEAMRRGLTRAGTRRANRLHLHYALGKALEDRREFEESFQNYAAGAALRRSEVAYAAADTTRLVERMRARFTAEFLDSRAGAGSDAPDPIFVVGLPRSGSTLVEQILASHPDIEGTMELPDVGLIARGLARTVGGRTSDLIDRLPSLSAADLTRLGEQYLETTRVHRKLSRALFIDKMPNNFKHIGLIRLILPRAKIIDVRRHPLGACFSAFKQHFAQGQSFSYDLDDLGRYYRDYTALMSHFDAVAPAKVHQLIYEDLIEDTEGEVRRLLDYCGVGFEPFCLRFYENDRAVKTVSSEQVRRPIFRGGLEQWRCYEPWLDPLKVALGSALNDWRGKVTKKG